MYPYNPERERVIRQSRLHTIHYRNLFDRNECEFVVGAILSKIDHLTIREFGIAFSSFSHKALVKIRDQIESRMTLYLEHAP